jgi:hypothetical protein
MWSQKKARLNQSVYWWIRSRWNAFATYEMQTYLTSEASARAHAPERHGDAASVVAQEVCLDASCHSTLVFEND